jgi:hypothetical protein
MKQINAKRYQQFIDVLERVRDNPEKYPFDMDDWVAFTDVGERPRTIEQFHTCGTSACAGGYLALSPEWQSCEGYTIDEGGGPAVVSDPADSSAESVADWLCSSEEPNELSEFLHYLFGLGLFSPKVYPRGGSDSTVTVAHVLSVLKDARADKSVILASNIGDDDFTLSLSDYEWV